jgi:hypothetical protein
MENLSLSVIPTATINQLQADMGKIISLLSVKNEEAEKNKWLPKKEARKNLNVCLKTFDTYLSKGILPYSRFAGKIYIKASDIEAHLQKHYISKI